MRSPCVLNMHLVAGQQQQQANVDGSTHLYVDIPEVESSSTSLPPPRASDIPLPDLEPGQSCVKKFYVKSTRPGERRFAVFVNYAIDAVMELPVTPPPPLHPSSSVIPTPVMTSSSSGDSPSSMHRRCSCLASAEFSTQAMRPFQIATKPLTAKFEATEVVFHGEPFLLTCDIKCVSEWPIQIKTSRLETSETVSLPDGELGNYV